MWEINLIKVIIEKLRDQTELTVVVDVDPVPPTAYEIERNIEKKTYRFRDIMAWNFYHSLYTIIFYFSILLLFDSLIHKK